MLISRWKPVLCVLTMAVVARWFWNLPLADWQVAVLSHSLPVPHSTTMGTLHYTDRTFGSVASREPKPPPTVKALVVLGTACHHGNGQPGFEASRRLQQAKWVLGREQGFDAVVLSGGIDSRLPAGLPTEAEIMSAWLSKEVPPQSLPHMLLENTSTSTRENAVESLALLRRHFPDDVSKVNLTIVTTPYHQTRAIRTFKQAQLFLEWHSVQLTVSVPPQTGTPFSDESWGMRQKHFWREVLASALYWVRGWA